MTRTILFLIVCCLPLTTFAYVNKPSGDLACTYRDRTAKIYADEAGQMAGKFANGEFVTAEAVSWGGNELGGLIDYPVILRGKYLECMDCRPETQLQYQAGEECAKHSSTSHLNCTAIPKGDLGIENVEYLDSGCLVTVGYFTHSRNYFYSSESDEITPLPNGTISSIDNGLIRIHGFKSYFNEGGAFWLNLLVDLSGNIIDVMLPTDSQYSRCVKLDKFMDKTAIDLSLVSRKEVCIEM